MLLCFTGRRQAGPSLQSLLELCDRLAEGGATQRVEARLSQVGESLIPDLALLRMVGEHINLLEWLITNLILEHLEDQCM